MKMECLKSFDLGVVPGWVCSANVRLKGRNAMLFLYSEGPATDPGEELLHFEGLRPVHLAVFEMDGTRLWDRELPSGVITGPWFVPVIPLDMDEDGQDEIYFVNNTGAPFSFLHRKLERADALTGETTGTWKWPDNTFHERLSYSYRFYLIGGYVHGKPVLITAQGTYGNMYLQGRGADMSPIWEKVILETEPGPRASHVTPVLDINEDGVDELLWGERVLSLEDGREIFNYAPEYNGHSDGIIPFRDYETGDWYIYTCREGDENPGVKRIVTFQGNGDIAWWEFEGGGHMHEAWLANIHGPHRKISMTLRNSGFTITENGVDNLHEGIFYHDAFTGERIEFPMPCEGTDMLPHDFNGDGYHEFYVFQGPLAGAVLNDSGEEVGRIPSDASCLRGGRILDRPGEQIMVKRADSSRIEIYGDSEAEDGEVMHYRYSVPYLTFMQKMTASGYNALHFSCAI